jgi:hypothetical protein
MESIPVLINWTTGEIEIVALNLTQDIILDEIEDYRKRIGDAQQKLSALPKNPAGFQERKKTDFKRRVLGQEVEHVKGLIRIAKEALSSV